MKINPKRRAAVLSLLSRIEALEKELQICSNLARKRQIISKLRLLRRDQERLAVKKRERTPSVTPLPKSYIEERREIRDAAAKISGRRKIAHFVQGGAPGTGRRK